MTAAEVRELLTDIQSRYLGEIVEQIWQLDRLEVRARARAGDLQRLRVGAVGDAASLLCAPEWSGRA
ncbi:MAG: hypothetical protein KY462_16595 [Actinobacteria bacterium]|nr:hypothetical protein [Actinomycetota bacterium]